MSLKQFLTAVNRIPEFDVGRALTRPVTNPLLKGVCGYILGIAVFGLGGMMIGAVLGIRTNEGAVRLLALGLGVVFAMTPNRATLLSGENDSTERPAV